MTYSQRISLGGVAWTVGALALFILVGSTSLAAWALLAVSLTPPMVYAALSGGPPITIAEVLYNAERGR